jgi:hypothetical protein
MLQHFRQLFLCVDRMIAIYEQAVAIGLRNSLTDFFPETGLRLS